MNTIRAFGLDHVICRFTMSILFTGSSLMASERSDLLEPDFIDENDRDLFEQDDRKDMDLEDDLMGDTLIQQLKRKKDHYEKIILDLSYVVPVPLKNQFGMGEGLPIKEGEKILNKRKKGLPSLVAFKKELQEFYERRKAFKNSIKESIATRDKSSKSDKEFIDSQRKNLKEDAKKAMATMCNIYKKIGAHILDVEKNKKKVDEEAIRDSVKKLENTKIEILSAPDILEDNNSDLMQQPPHEGIINSLTAILSSVRYNFLSLETPYQAGLDIASKHLVYDPYVGIGDDDDNSHQRMTTKNLNLIKSEVESYENTHGDVNGALAGVYNEIHNRDKVIEKMNKTHAKDKKRSMQLFFKDQRNEIDKLITQKTQENRYIDELKEGYKQKDTELDTYKRNAKKILSTGDYKTSGGLGVLIGIFGTKFVESITSEERGEDEDNDFPPTNLNG